MDCDIKFDEDAQLKIEMIQCILDGGSVAYNLDIDRKKGITRYDDTNKKMMVVHCRLALCKHKKLKKKKRKR